MKLRTRLFGKNAFSEKNLNYKILSGDYYNAEIKCKNCGFTTIVYFKKGVHINDVINTVKCSNCDCRLEKI